jgi:hypothetical protein
MNINVMLTILKTKTKEVTTFIVEDNKGDGYVDTAVKIIIAAVVGAAVLAGIYAMVVNFVLPNVNTKVQGLFNDPTGAGT